MPKSEKVTAPTPTVPQNAAIFAQDLNFTYNPKSGFAKHALINVDLTVCQGEFVAIVGHTGSGKTTFVQHLNALIRVQSGYLNVLGQDLSAKKPDLKLLRRQVGMVFQYPEYQLFADTVLADVCFGLKNFGIDKDERENMAREALELVGLDFAKVKDKSPFDLSGGEKRRVALAGVLAMKPKILVLDEPTAGLDPRGKSEILTLVKKLNQTEGVTVLMVSHDMNEVYENAKNSWCAMLIAFLSILAFVALSVPFILLYIFFHGGWYWLLLMWIVDLGASAAFTAVAYKIMNGKAARYFERIEV